VNRRAAGTAEQAVADDGAPEYQGTRRKKTPPAIPLLAASAGKPPHARDAIRADAAFEKAGSVHGQRPLSARERQCLMWVATGKTDWEIAEIVGISHQTVHKHIVNALRRLDATTRAHAVAIAITLRLIRIQLSSCEDGDEAAR